MGGLETLRSLSHFELDLLAFLERAEALGLDGSVMDENVLGTVTRDKAITLAVVEPLDGSRHLLGHLCYYSLQRVLTWGEAVSAGIKNDCPVSAVQGSLSHHGQNSLRPSARDVTTDVQISQIAGHTHPGVAEEGQVLVDTADLAG